jgi:hypothetical protein
MTGFAKGVRRALHSHALAVGYIVVTLLALALRIYYVSRAHVINPVRGDAVEYVSYAWNILHHGTFSRLSPGSLTVVADGFRDPGYPLFLAAMMRLFGEGDAWYSAVLLMQAALGAATVGIALSLTRQWLPWRWRVAAGCLAAVWPHCITITSFLLSETLFSFLVVSALAFTGLALRTHRWPAAAMAGLLFAAGALTNAVLLPFGLLLGAALILRDVGQRRCWLVMLACTALPLVAWQVRATHLPPNESSRDRAAMNFVQGSWPTFQDDYIRSVRGDPAGRATMMKADAEYKRLVTQPADGASSILARFAADPVLYMGWYASKPALLWDWRIRIGQGDVYVYPTADSPFDTDPPLRALIALARAANPLVGWLALAGVILSFRRGQPWLAVIGATLLLFVTLVYATLQAEPRYSIPFRPLELTYACAALAAITNSVRAVLARQRV